MPSSAASKLSLTQHELRSQTIEFGACSGTKFLVDRPFKRVDDLLRVPGGYVWIMLTGMGAAFDETEFEAQLHTLHVSGADESFDSLTTWGRWTARTNVKQAQILPLIAVVTAFH